MKPTQTQVELDHYYRAEDPWGYFTNPHDAMRKKVLLSAMHGYEFSKALDVGCGNGFITQSLPVGSVLGVDISASAIEEARARAVGSNVRYETSSLFELSPEKFGTFDLILITGVLYQQYIGNSLPLVYQIVDRLLEKNGVLISVHIDEWYLARFPYARTSHHRYKYREFNHLLEIYRK